MTRPLVALAILGLLIVGWLGPAWSASEDDVWVRVHHETGHPAAQRGAATADLDDYGAFQWGRLSVDQARAMEQAGGRLTRIENPFELNLGGERIDLLDETGPGRRVPPHQAAAEGDFHLIQFRGPVRSQWLQDLRGTGVTVIQPIHPFSYYVWADADQISAASRLPDVRASTPVRPAWRMQTLAGTPDQRSQQPMPYMALISRHARRDTLERMRSKGAVIHSVTRESAHFDVVHLVVSGQNYPDLARIPGIYVIQPVPRDPGPRGEMSNQSIVGGFDGDSIIPGYADWLAVTGYDGEGITVSVVDNGIDEDHPDLIDNILDCLGPGGSCTGAAGSHGTHVAGAIAGTGLSGEMDHNDFLRGQGAAPSASLVNQDYRPFLGTEEDGMVADGMLTIMADAALSGAMISNNSWGPSGSPQGYNIPSRHIDLISRDALPDDPDQHPILAVWSIMNGWGDSPGACAPSSLGAPDEAKNLFAVGSTNLQNGDGEQQAMAEIFSISANSGHGPACDGRRVPDIVAPGCSTDSTDLFGAHSMKCGTSMASPLVSGAVAVWAQRHIDETGSPPSAALTRAVFSAAARDLAGGTNADGGTLGHRPDRFQGFGRIDLDAVMNPTGGSVFLLDQEVVFDDTGQDWALNIQAADPDEPIKVMLTWTDAPGHGNGGTTPAWVNILDLVVEAGDDNTYLGNVTGPDGWSAPGGQPDDRNNSEGIWLRPDQHQGQIQLNVLATSLAGDALNPYDPGDPSQDFAIACYNCIEGDPGFNLALEPTSLQACLSDQDGIFDIDVLASPVGPYTETVELNQQGLPADIDSSFDPSSIDVPGSSTWTLSTDEHSAPAHTLVTVEAEDGEGLKRSSTLYLRLDAPLTELPDPVAPADNSTDQSLTPEIAWTAVSGEQAQNYQLQVAATSDFSQPLVDELVFGTSFVPDEPLPGLSDHYWRVRAINLCGPGNWSPVRQFTTRPAPLIAVSPEVLTFVVPVDGQAQQSLLIDNSGTGDLQFDIATNRPGQAASGAQALISFDDPANWQLINDPEAVAGSVEFTQNAALEILLIGGDDGVGGNTDLQIDIPADGTLQFDWGYQSLDPGNFDSASYLINQDETELADNDSQVSFHQAQASVSVGAGDRFTLRVNTVDGLFGPGELGVTGVQLEVEACNDSAPGADWLDVAPSDGLISGGDSAPVEVTVDSSGLSDGLHHAVLCVASNADNDELLAIPVQLEVGSPPIFHDRFEADD
ncbi:S8 family serine peptidase [Wenzhouxiangella sp. AB-CW3]|uniref:S8 family serine peptidase n=1 Tax=Wenzhouxiangella sp. AB-CW3 TaxID=2771012 RepID=UPI00168A6E0F|nr:S8 family serine peptidase [Wenzhouxiangella sp. AB-CW3]QOC21167.1 S8 family serine peptidase [Wenzhouxiangella sp. AB-CW3]